ncbi:ATP-binding protein [Isoptericola sp. b408]|uniref:ATP-binding protein n=1 Tax=Isoptericola sp. b408 TaxID=3064653 RepID=UPI002713ABD9|nr:ATP-binding protein [Isoptericola sp. b408]MDO8149909.1 ATP-binding protein [Isoptericola sp. b408]
MDPRITAAPAPYGFREVRSWPLLTIEQLPALRGDLEANLPTAESASLDAVPEAIVLVASELATNAIEHGDGPAAVRLLERDGELLLDVADRASGTTPRITTDPCASGGFGLVLAARLADAVGWYATQAGKHVWARFTVETREPSLTA